MSETAFRPARSMSAQLDELHDEVDTQKHAARSALEHVAFLQQQYRLALDSICRANREIFAWRYIAFWTGVALILASALA